MKDNLEFPALKKYGERLKRDAKIILGDMERNLTEIATLREQSRERKEAYIGIRNRFLEEIHSNIPEEYKGKTREKPYQSGQLDVIEKPDVYYSQIKSEGKQEQTQRQIQTEAPQKGVEEQTQRQIQTEAPQKGVDYTTWGLGIGGTLALAVLGTMAVRYRQRNRTPKPAIKTYPIEPDRR